MCSSPRYRTICGWRTDPTHDVFRLGAYPVRPKLPTQAPASVDPEDIGILEIIVSATGAVEQVRLISTANRFEESMLVAAAKAWPFEPATKDGRRVRYRTRIRVTL